MVVFLRIECVLVSSVAYAGLDAGFNAGLSTFPRQSSKT